MTKLEKFTEAEALLSAAIEAVKEAAVMVHSGYGGGASHATDLADVAFRTLKVARQIVAREVEHCVKTS